jgi:hypothetical protein
MKKLPTVKKIFVCGAALCAGIWILLSCQNPSASSPETPAALLRETGRVRLAIHAPALNRAVLNGARSADSSGPQRSILPNEPDFSKYVLRFEGRNGQAAVDPLELGGGATKASFALLAGNWTIGVTGYVVLAGTEQEAAQGSVDIVVDAEELEASVILRPLEEGAEGTLSYSVAFPAVVTSASLTLAAPDAPGDAVKTYNLKEKAADTVALAPGYYVIALTLKTESNGVVIQQAGAADIVKINSAMVTEAAYAFVDGDFVAPLLLSGTLALSDTNPEALGDITLSFHTEAPDYGSETAFNDSRMAFVTVAPGTHGTSLWNGTWSAALNPALFGETVYFSLAFGDIRAGPVNTPSIAKPGTNTNNIALWYFPAPVVTGGDQSITVTWIAAPGTDKYRVYYGTTDNAEEATQAAGDIALPSTTIAGLAKGTRYYVWIRAGAGDNWSAFGPVAEGWTAPDTPAAPVLSGTTAKAMTVAWTPVAGASSYEVFYNTTNDHSSETKLAVDDPTAAKVNLAGLADGTTYYVWVRAKNVSGTSAYSPAASRTTTPQAPEPPAILKTGTGFIDISWRPVIGASGYEVYLQTNASNAWSASASDGAKVSHSSPVTEDGSSNYTLRLTQRGASHLAFENPVNLVNGATYYARVRAINESSPVVTSDFRTGCSNVSAPAIPIAPPGITVSSADGEIKITPAIGTGADTLWVYWASGLPADLPALSAWTKYPAPVAANTSIATGLANFSRHYVYAKAGKADGSMESDSAGPIAVIVGAPAAPILSAGSGKIDASWNTIADATSYKVYYHTANNPDAATPHSDNPVTGSSVTIDGLTDNTLYYVWVTASKNGEDTSFSFESHARTIAQATAPVIGQSGNRTLEVSWAAVPGATSYELRHSTGTDVNTATVYGASLSEISAAVSNLSNFDNHYFWVRAKNSDSGIGNWSPMSAAGMPGTPAAPVVEAGNGQLGVSWTAVAGATTYEVHYGTVNDSSQATRWAGSITGTGATITGLANNTIYYVWLKVGNGTITSPFGPPGSQKTSELIHISNLADFMKIGTPGSGFPDHGRYILDTDLILEDWPGILYFSGTFDGNGKTVTLDHFDDDYIRGNNYVGIFVEVVGTTAVKAEIKNLTVAVTINGQTGVTNGKIGVLAGRARHTVFQNIRLTGAIGAVNSPGITLPIASGTHSSVYGGIAAELLNGSSIQDSTSAITAHLQGVWRTGGLAGTVNDSTIQNSANIAGIQSLGVSVFLSNNPTAGGIAGYIGSDSLLDHCRNTANLTHSSNMNSYVGGLVGQQGEGSRIRRSYCSGDVLVIGGASQVTCGGITGTIRGGAAALIEDCYSTGKVESRCGADGQPAAGGILGFPYQDNAVIQRCYATGEITAENPAGGSGYASGIADTYVVNCLALNGLVQVRHTLNSGQQSVHRVSRVANTNNLAYSGMVLKKILNGSETTVTATSDLNGPDGLDCDLQPAQSVYESLGWDFATVWVMGGNGYPGLRDF